MKIGPFFVIDDQLIYNACDVAEGEERAGKRDNPYSHERLYDEMFSAGEYMDFPRGRVVFDEVENAAIVYLDRCIRNDKTIEAVKTAFQLDRYTLGEDDHYRCKNCLGDLWNE